MRGEARRSLLVLGLFGFLAFALSPQGSEAVLEGKNCAPEPTDMFVQSGDYLGGSNCCLDPVGDTDVFRFSGSIGETIIAQVARLGGGTPCVELFGPYGQRTPNGGQVCTTGGAQIVETVHQAGVHTLVVSEFFNDQTLGYSVTAQCVGQCPPPPLPPAPICEIQLSQTSYTNGETVTAVQVVGGARAGVPLPPDVADRSIESRMRVTSQRLAEAWAQTLTTGPRGREGQESPAARRFREVFEGALRNH